VWWQRFTAAEHERNMRAAVRVALTSDGAKIGAVVLHDGHLVAEGVSVVRPACDPTAHAEVNAIRKAAAALRRFHLDDCVLYSTLEPCGMCFSACAWAGLGLVVFGADSTVTPDIYYEQSRYCAIGRAKQTRCDIRRTPLEIVGGVLLEETSVLLPPREDEARCL
jgi:tRNA(Arg) A34 adenosine deaminase TadA